MKIPWSELKEVLENDDNEGFCVSCGALHGRCEPDAQRYECEECGESKVYGAEEILLRDWVDYSDNYS